MRENLANGARFFVAHDELSVNRPANRLIRSALTRLAPGIRSEENRLLLRRLTAAFAHVPDENGGDKLVHGSGGISQLRAE